MVNFQIPARPAVAAGVGESGFYAKRFPLLRFQTSWRVSRPPSARPNTKRLFQGDLLPQWKIH